MAGDNTHTIAACHRAEASRLVSDDWLIRTDEGGRRMSSKVGQDSNYVAHHVEVAIGSREAEVRARKLRQLAVSACVVGFLLVAAFILL